MILLLWLLAIGWRLLLVHGSLLVVHRRSLLGNGLVRYLLGRVDCAYDSGLAPILPEHQSSSPSNAADDSNGNGEEAHRTNDGRDDGSSTRRTVVPVIAISGVVTHA